MKDLILLITLGTLLLAAAFFIVKHRQPLGEFFANVVTITAINITPKGRATRLADASFTARYLIAKQGSDATHIDICTAADKPFAMVPDMTPSTETYTGGYPLPINMLGLNEDTERGVANGAIAVDDMLVPAAAGGVKTLPTSGGGTTYILGKAVSVALATGDLVEFIPCFPYLVTIAS